jgi:hypothetical protein
VVCKETFNLKFTFNLTLLLFELCLLDQSLVLALALMVLLRLALLLLCQPPVCVPSLLYACTRGCNVALSTLVVRLQGFLLFPKRSRDKQQHKHYQNVND